MYAKLVHTNAIEITNVLIFLYSCVSTMLEDRFLVFSSFVLVFPTFISSESSSISENESAQQIRQYKRVLQRRMHIWCIHYVQCYVHLVETSIRVMCIRVCAPYCAACVRACVPVLLPMLFDRKCHRLRRSNYHHVHHERTMLYFRIQ